VSSSKENVGILRTVSHFAQAVHMRFPFTRHKILIGAVVMAKIEQKVMPEEQPRTWLDETLSRLDNRSLFGLPPRSA
jgi:hypothetical protein